MTTLSSPNTLSTITSFASWLRSLRLSSKTKQTTTAVCTGHSFSFCDGIERQAALLTHTTPTPTSSPRACTPSTASTLSLSSRPFLSAATATLLYDPNGHHAPSNAACCCLSPASSSFGAFGSCGKRERGGREFSSSARDFGVAGARDGGYGFAPRDRDRDVRDTHPSSYTLHQQQHSDFDLDPPGSGATSRRHSVSVVQPHRRLAGFHVPDAAGGGSPSPGPSAPGGYAGGGGAGSNNNGRGFGGGGLLLSDDDLEIGLGGLSLHSATSPSNAYGGGLGQRRREDSLSGRYDERGYDDLRGGGGDRMGERERVGSLPIHAPLAIGRSPSLSMGLGLGGLGGGGVSPSEARGGGGADIRGGGAAGGKDWASDVSAYFSPPRELNINTNLGGGGGAGRGEFPQYEGGGRGRGRRGTAGCGAGVACAAPCLFATLVPVVASSSLFFSSLLLSSLRFPHDADSLLRLLH
ncbi:hypothetical protein B0H14DRAFT_3893513, partial [Mycena olivaceomarginata]